MLWPDAPASTIAAPALTSPPPAVDTSAVRSAVLASALLVFSAAVGCASSRPAAPTMASRARPVAPARWIASTPGMRSLLRALTLADRVAVAVAESPLGIVRGDTDRLTAHVVEARAAYQQASRAGALLDCETLDDVHFAQAQTEPGSDVWGPYPVAGSSLDFVATRSTVTPFIHRDPREAGIAVRSSAGRLMITLGCGESLAVVDASSSGRPRCQRYGACPSAEFLPLLVGEQVDLEDIATRLRRRGPSAREH